MIPNSTLILGPPGCGKTYTLIQKVKEKLSEGVMPHRIGVVSFTTKAIHEFISRACAEFNLTPKDFPHFRTLHATGYHGLGLQRTDVLDKYDYSKIGDMLGLVFAGADSSSMDDGIQIPTMLGSGSKYLQTIMRATYREKDLDWEYNYTNDRSMVYAKLIQLDKQLKLYKQHTNKFDFADMIRVYVEQVEPPELDLLIVDEAQDLTPLQWSMAEKMAENSDEVIIAGDDDQAIHRWTSVDVNRFINCSPNVEVLSQSYRLPRSVWSLARRISRRIPGRIEKEFLPKDGDEGQVTRVLSLWGLPLHRGSWTIMARTNTFVDDISNQLRDMGHYFSVKGRPSVSRKAVETMIVWRELQEGKGIGISRLQEFYKSVPKAGLNPVVKRGSSKLLEAADPETLLTYQELSKNYGLICSIDTDPMDVANLGDREKVYVRAIERRGESVYGEPRIKLSTIHAMKGGEDENVAVYTGSTKSCVLSRHPEDEHRIFYVAVTRTKQNLYIIESDKKYRYTI